jgi:MFS family permease
LFKHQNNFNKSELVYYISFATSGLNFGAILGILLYTKVIKYFRTRESLLLTDFISIISVLIMLYSLNPIRIGIARFFFGIASGLSASILPVYLNSISPTQIRGKIGTINQIMIGLGMIFAYLINFILVQDIRDQIRWRILLGFPLLPTILRVLFFQYYFNFDTIESHL